jgi:hypothetical protein
LIQPRSSHLADGTGTLPGRGQLPFLATKTVPARFSGLVTRPRLLANLSELPAKRLGADIPLVREVTGSTRVITPSTGPILAVTQRATQRRNMDLDTDGLEKILGQTGVTNSCLLTNSFTSAFKQSNQDF